MKFEQKRRLLWAAFVTLPLVSIASQFYMHAWYKESIHTLEVAIAKKTYSDRFIARDKGGNAVVVTSQAIVFKSPKQETLRLKVSTVKKKGKVVGLVLKAH